MKKNMGNIDRIVRVALAAVVATLFFTHVIEGTLAYILLGLSGVFVATSLVGYCPLYAIFGIRTCKA
jgi:uncharacterized membrane protein YeaQ/YmgE (transglycosylase-associated protein family)